MVEAATTETRRSEKKKSQGTYSVVVFRDENKVEVVPSTWLFNNNSLCFWPVDRSKVPSYVNRYQPPDVDKWLMCTNITELGIYETLLQAKQKLPRAENQSDLSSTETEEREKNREKRKRSPSPSSSDEENSDPPPPVTKYPTSTKIFNVAGSSSQKSLKNVKKPKMSTVNKSHKNTGVKKPNVVTAKLNLTRDKEILSQPLKTQSQNSVVEPESNPIPPPSPGFSEDDFELQQNVGHNSPSPQEAEDFEQSAQENVKKASTVEKSRKKTQVNKLKTVVTKLNLVKEHGTSSQQTSSQRQKSVVKLAFESSRVRSTSPGNSQDLFEQSQDSRNSSPGRDSTQNNGDGRGNKTPFSSHSRLNKIPSVNRNQNSTATNVKTPSRFVGRTLKSVDKSASKCPKKVDNSKELSGNDMQVILRYFEKIITMVKVQGEEINSLSRTVNRLAQQRKTYSGKKPQLPFKTYDEFEEFDLDLTTNSGLKEWIEEQIETTGGKDDGDCTRAVMRNFLSLPLAKEFSWAGRVDSGKRKWKNTELCAVIQGAVANLFEVSKYEIGKKMAAHLKSLPQANRNSANLNNGDDDDNDDEENPNDPFINSDYSSDPDSGGSGEENDDE